MNEKERIFELVRNNVISLEEALDLLESAGRSTEQVEQTASSDTTVETDVNQTPHESKTSKPSFKFKVDEKAIEEVVNKGVSFGKEIVDSVAKVTTEVVNELKQEYQKEKAKEQSDEQDFVAEYQAAQKAVKDQLTDPETKMDLVDHMKQVTDTYKEIDEQIKQLKANNSTKEEALLVAKQRLREIEVFAELDELSPEMIDQRQKYQAKLVTLEADQADYQRQLSALQARKEALLKSHLQKDQVKQFVDEAMDTVSDKANQLGSKASRGGRIIGNVVKRTVSDIAKQLKAASGELSTKHQPYTQTLTHTFEFKEAVKQVDLHIQRDGEIHLTTWDEVYTQIEAELLFTNASETTSVADFEKQATIGVVDGRLIFHTQNKQTSANLTIKLPKGLVETLVCEADEAIILDNLVIREANIQTINADVMMRDSRIAFLDLRSVNGDVLVEHSVVDDAVMKNINGDFRNIGQVGNVSINTVNSDVFITKEDLDPSVLNITTTNGDIKIAMDASVGLEAHCQTSLGDIKQRLAGAQVNPLKGKQQQIQRYLNEDSPLVKVEATTTNGDILFKDI